MSSGRTARERPPARRISLRRVVVPVIVIGAALLASAAWSPLPPGWDGVTLCYPFVGPVQRFDPQLPDSTRLRIRVHEDAHAEQCRRSGAIRHFLSLSTTRGRLKAEAAANCAEAAYEVALGRPAYLEHERIVDDLHYGHPFVRGVSDSVLRAAIRQACPALAAAAHR